MHTIHGRRHKSNIQAASGASLVVVGCVATKVDTVDAVPACDLYASHLWRLRRGFAERSSKRWFIMSAQYGVIAHNKTIQYYDKRLKESAYRDDAYVTTIMVQLLEIAGELDVSTLKIEAHVGKAYFLPLERAAELLAPVITVELDWPVRGLQIGELKRWYKRGDGGKGHEPPPPPEEEVPSTSVGGT